ncbi:MAG: permease-like cell division protein FtsX [Erysipelotrichaceae bacterium]
MTNKNLNNKNEFKKYIKSIPYHFNNALKSIARHIAMSISSATAVTVTLILMMLFLVVACNISNFTTNIEESVQILVRVDNIVSKDKDIEAIGDLIKAVPNVTNVEFSTKDQELDKYITSVSGAKEMFESYRGKQNPMLNAYVVDVKSGEALEQVTKDVSAIKGVYDAKFGGDSASKMVDAFGSIRTFGTIFVLALSALAVFLISNTIKITIYARNTEISIMRSVGATASFIKTPFMIEGMIIGFMGSIIPILLTCFGYSYLYGAMDGYIISSMFTLLPVTPFVAYVSLGLALIGMVVGLLGSFFSVNKYLKWRR